MSSNNDTEPDAQKHVPVAHDKVDRLGRWLTLGANIGVLLGLIILIAEVRQNASISRAAMELQANSEQGEIEMMIARPEISTVWMKSIHAPETLSDVEIRILDGVLASVLLQNQQRFLMAREGIVTEARARQHMANSIPFYFGSRFGKQWWAQQAVGWEGSGIIEIGDQMISELDDNFLIDYSASLRLAPPVKSSVENDVIP